MSDPQSPSPPPRAARRVLGLLAVAAAWVAVAVVAAPWPVYAFDMATHFAPHAGVIILLASLLAALRRRPRGAILSALAGLTLLALTHAWVHAPVGEGPVPPGHQRIRLVLYNAQGHHSRHDNAFSAWLRDQDADLIAIVDCAWGYLHDQPWLRERYPYHIEPRAGMEWPIILLSRFPAEVTPLVPYSEETKMSFVSRRSMLVSFDGGARVLFTAMHPPSPRRAALFHRALRVVERDGPMLRDWSAITGVPVIVAGDFNSTPAARVHRAFAAGSGLRGWSPLLRAGTWPSNISPYLSVPIDRIWTSPTLAVRSAAVGPRFRSDHRPVVAVIDLPPGAGAGAGVPADPPAGSSGGNP